MERPETISPEVWAKLNDEHRKFLAFHEEMHGKLQELWGVSREEYYSICNQIILEGED